MRNTRYQVQLGERMKEQRRRCGEGCIPSPFSNISLTLSIDVQCGFLQTWPVLPHLWCVCWGGVGGLCPPHPPLERMFPPSYLCSSPYPLFLSSLLLNNFYWSIVALQCCVSFPNTMFSLYTNMAGTRLFNTAGF